MNEQFLGSVLAIPAGGEAVFAKVIFASQYFADVVAVKLYSGKLVGAGPLEALLDEDRAEVYYTSGAPIRSKRWKVIGQLEVTDGERLSTERTAGGEIWIEDRHVGKASDDALHRLPTMLVHGSKLIEKYAARSCI